MMQGFINQNCEAIIRLAVGHADDSKQMVEAVIDTGFTDFLSLPFITLETLGLPWIFRDFGTLGDGSEVIPLTQVGVRCRLLNHYCFHTRWRCFPLGLRYLVPTYLYRFCHSHSLPDAAHDAPYALVHLP